jgi:hypothetical protein
MGSIPYSPTVVDLAACRHGMAGARRGLLLTSLQGRLAMAEKLESFDFDKVKGIGVRDQFLDGGVWRLVKGVDFDCSIESVRTRLSSRALALGGKVRTHKESPESLVVQFFKGGNGNQKK